MAMARKQEPIESRLNKLFRKRLATIQSERGWTQTETARRMKIPQPHLSIFINGRDATINNLEKWAKRLKFDLAEIFLEK